MNSSLSQIVISNIEFFALAPDSAIDPDVAVRQLEIISATLKQLPERELSDFLRKVMLRLEELRVEGASTEQLKFLEDLPENLGVGT